MAWLVPNHYPPWTSFYNDACAAVGLLLIAVGVAAPPHPTGTPRLVWAIVGLAAIPWLQWGAGLVSFSGDAWVSTVYIFGFATAVFAGSCWARADARTMSESLAIAILVAACASSVLAISEVLGTFPIGMWGVQMPEGGRPGANLGQSNNLATLLAFGTLSVLLLLEQARIGKILAIALLALLVAGLAASQSRIALAFGPIIWFGVWLGRARIGFRTRPRYVGIAAIAASVSLWIEPLFLRTGDLLASQSVAGRGIQSLRFQVWPILFDGLSSHPWSGFGWLQVSAAELAAAGRHPPVGELWAQGHNLFVELLVWCGYPLGLFLGATVLYWFVTRCIRVRSVESAIGMLVIAVAGAHSMTEFPYQYGYFLVPTGLWIGLVEDAIGSHGARRPWVYPTLVTSSFVLLVAVCWCYAAVEDDFRLVRFESRRIGSVHAAQPAPDAPFLSALTAFLEVARITPRVGMSGAELDRMGAVVRRFPYAALMSSYATAMALNGRPDDARRMFATILHIHGATIYGNLKKDLDEAALTGPAPLRLLDATVPP